MQAVIGLSGPAVKRAHDLQSRREALRFKIFHHRRNAALCIATTMCYVAIAQILCIYPGIEWNLSAVMDIIYLWKICYMLSWRRFRPLGGLARV